MKVKIKLVLTSPTYKVICVSGGPGDLLEKHKVDEAAMLLVKKGRMIYQEKGEAPITLSENEGQNIPAEIYHQLSCVDEAEAFVIIPLQAKMKFER